MIGFWRGQHFLMNQLFQKFLKEVNFYTNSCIKLPPGCLRRVGEGSKPIPKLFRKCCFRRTQYTCKVYLNLLMTGGGLGHLGAFCHGLDVSRPWPWRHPVRWSVGSNEQTRTNMSALACRLEQTCLQDIVTVFNSNRHI